MRKKVKALHLTACKNNPVNCKDLPPFFIPFMILLYRASKK